MDGETATATANVAKAPDCCAPSGLKKEYSYERKILDYCVGALSILLFTLALMYIGLWKNIPNFITQGAPLLGIGAVSVVAVVGTAYQYIAYRKPISCSIAMMEGMTFGMMAGFMSGALIGATNGMFWGSMFGMGIGIAAGVWAGSRGGIMGLMEGIMGGLMAGTMGAMLSVMLLAEALPVFLAVLALVCVAVLVALAFMHTDELGSIESKEHIPTFVSLSSTALLVFVALSLVMIYGPKAGPVWVI